MHKLNERRPPRHALSTGARRPRFATAVLGVTAALAVAGAVVAAPASASGSFYISPSGTDSGSCTLSAPCHTPYYASSKMQPGDVLYARGGTYKGLAGTWKSPSGTSTAPMTFTNYPGETPVFDGGGSSSDFMLIVGTDWVTVDGISVENYNGSAGIWIGYSGSGSDYATHDTVRNSTFNHMGDSTLDHAIYVSYGVQAVTLNNNTIVGTYGAGLHFYHAPGVNGAKVFNNVIVGGYYGMVFGNAATNLQIYNNTVVGAKYGIYLYSDTTNATIEDNIFSADTYMTVAPATVTHNLFYNTPVAGSSALTASPQFVNASANDYHLQSGSPAIDVAANVGVLTDHDGVPRPSGNGYDLGAYENTATATTSPSPSPSPTSTPSSSPTPTPTSTSALTAMAIDAGSTIAYTDSTGAAWGKDGYFSGGSLLDRGTSLAISGTTDPRLYQTEHYGMSSYTLPVANGTYTVSLGFAENSVTKSGQRVFDVALNGTKVLSRFDIFALAGAHHALVKSFTVSVTNGQLVIGFTAIKATPVINTIAVS